MFHTFVVGDRVFISAWLNRARGKRGTVVSVHSNLDNDQGELCLVEFDERFDLEMSQDRKWMFHHSRIEKLSILDRLAEL
jgi:hypothetical protein